MAASSVSRAVVQTSCSYACRSLVATCAIIGMRVMALMAGAELAAVMSPPVLIMGKKFAALTAHGNTWNVYEVTIRFEARGSLVATCAIIDMRVMALMAGAELAAVLSPPVLIMGKKFAALTAHGAHDWRKAMRPLLDPIGPRDLLLTCRQCRDAMWCDSAATPIAVFRVMEPLGAAARRHPGAPS
eukprot:1156982-Pelagomonas_calceolata.AAC.2